MSLLTATRGTGGSSNNLKDVEELGYSASNGIAREREYVRSTDQPFLPVFKGARIANPSPLAFSAVAVSLYLLSMVALNGDNLTQLSVVNSVALGYSFFALLIAGIWEFPSGNTFGAALYVTLAGLFGSLTLLLSPWSGVAAAYADLPHEFPAAVAQFVFAWFITIVVFTVAANRSSGGLIIFMSLVDLTLLFLALAYQYPTHTSLLKVSGSFGIVSSFVAWYATLASLTTAESSLFQLPVLGDFSKRD